MQKYYSVEETAKIVGMHPKTVARYIREGKLAANKVGKEWRISGHDLSVFVEGQAQTGETMGKTKVPIRVSAVVDVPDVGKQAAMRIANTLTAASVGRGDDELSASVTTQYIENEHMLRVMLWGSPRYMEVMMGTISALTDTD